VALMLGNHDKHGTVMPADLAVSAPQLLKSNDARTRGISL